MEVKVSKDRRTTEDNPAFLAYVLACIANDMRESGNPAHVIADRLAAEKVAEHGRMQSDVFIPEEDFKRQHNALVQALKNFAAQVLMDRAAVTRGH